MDRHGDQHVSRSYITGKTYRRLEDMMLAMKLQYFGHIVRKNNTIEKQIMLGSEEGMIRRERVRITSFVGVRELIAMTMEQLDIVTRDRHCWRSHVIRVTRAWPRPAGTCCPGNVR